MVQAIQTKQHSEHQPHQSQKRPNLRAVTVQQWQELRLYPRTL